MQIITQPPLLPLSKDEARQAEASSQTLQRLLANETPSLSEATLYVRLEAQGERTELRLPGAILPLLSQILRDLGAGKNVAALTTDAEVTTQQAANLLHVSRPYLVKLLEAGDIPYRRVGPRRRIRLGDLLRYQEREEEAARHRGLDELVAEAQQLGLY